VKFQTFKRSSNFNEILKEVKILGYRIIILLCESQAVQTVLSEAASLEITSAKWVWILSSDVINYVPVSKCLEFKLMLTYWKCS